MRGVLAVVAVLGGCSVAGDGVGTHEQALAAPWVEGPDAVRPDACGCEALDERVGALEEGAGLPYWRTEASESAEDCNGPLVALCDVADVVLSGSCLGPSGYAAGGPVIRDGAYGWECFHAADGSCGLAVTALCEPR